MISFARCARLLAAAALVSISSVAVAQGRGPAPGQHGPGGPGPSGGGSGAPPGQGRASNNDRGGSGANRNALQIGPSGRWWDDKSVVRSVGLRGEQQRQMDAIFNANKPAILARYKALLTEQDKLSALNKSAQPQQSAVFAQIDAVAQARASLQKATTQMLLQIRQQLDAGQVEKLEQVP